MKTKKILKIILIIVLCIIVICGIYLGIHFKKYATDITAQEKRIIEGKLNDDPSNYVNIFVLGEEKIDDKHTNYYAVLYENTFVERKSWGKKIKGTFYSEKTEEEIEQCKGTGQDAIQIIRTTGEGKDLVVENFDSAICTDFSCYVKQPDAPDFLMIWRGQLFKANKDELNQMDQKDRKRIKDLGYTVIK